MRSAIYYPHTRMRSEALLKSSLLLWDQVEFIAPEVTFAPAHESPEFAEATELIGHYRHPTEEEKREVHALVEDFATSPLPEALFYRPDQQDHIEYGIYPQKFLPDTWHMLNELQLANLPKGDSRHRIDEATGLTMMSLLADCCAGTTRARITDRNEAYANIVNLATQNAEPADPNCDVAVPLTLRLVDTATVPLKALIEFRRKEEKSQGHDMRRLRHRYAERIEAYIELVRTKGKKANDREEIQRLFEQDMKDDLAVLRDELSQANAMALASEAVVSVAVTGIAAAAELLTLGFPFVLTGMTANEAVTKVGGVFRAGSELAAKRKEIMRKHPMAYMHELGQFAPYHA